MKRFKVILYPCNLTSIDEELTYLSLFLSLSLSYQMDVMALKAGKFEDDLRDSKKEMSDLVRQIQRLKHELEAQKKKVRLRH